MRSLKLSEAIEEFGYELSIRNYSKKTIKVVINNLLNFEQYQSAKGKFHVAEVTTLDVKKFINSYQEKGCKPSYINRKLNAIHILYKYLEEEELLPYESNPTNKVKRLIKDKPQIIVFNDTEIAAMIKKHDTSTFRGIRDKVIIMLLYEVQNTLFNSNVFGFLFILGGLLKIISIIFNWPFLRALAISALIFMWTFFLVSFLLSPGVNSLWLLPLAMIITSFGVVMKEWFY